MAEGSKVEERTPRARTVSLHTEAEVAHLRLLRPTITMRMVHELGEALDQLEDHSAARFVVISGVDGVFCAGIDFADFRPDAPMDIHGFHKWEQLLVRVEKLGKATVAAIDGPCRGGGAQLALVCDVRVATARSVVQFDEIHLGFLPGMGTWRLAKYVGLGRAKRLLLQGAPVSAAAAERIGLIDVIAEDGALDAAVAAELAAFGPAHPVATELGKRLLLESYAESFEENIGGFLAAQHRAISQSAFLETLKKAGR